jgi:sulfate adenylyltransferase
MRYPLVAEMASWGKAYISGPSSDLPKHDFVELRRTPAQVKFARVDGISNVVAFQTRNPSIAHAGLRGRPNKGLLVDSSGRGFESPGTSITLPVCAPKIRVDKHYDKSRTLLSLPPLAMDGWTREAVWHAIIRRNHGVNHFIVGRDHADPDRTQGSPSTDPTTRRLAAAV